eukprot:TRINITY_DN5417_c2_g1_i2.p1 TRINITY_DN5417_c2_g1~~TRINITY_DN5417_c2_g1_i2.p1  ORF type:complete len:577 (+),score=49.67 TRINITY_DN5417_c2_g1_i2:245-1732(+)
MVRLAQSLDIAHGSQTSQFSATLFNDGQTVPPNIMEKGHKHFRQLRREVARVGAQLSKDDCSWFEALRRMRNRPSLSPEEQAMLHLEIYNSCENYEGARFDCWSAKNWNKVTCLAGGNGDVDGGYGSLIVAAGEDLDVRFGRRVVSVLYSNQETGLVHVQCAAKCSGEDSKETYCAPRCVVTLPLGVLRSGYVHFQPELPPSKIEAINTLGTALMDKVELLWHRRWWPGHIGSFQIASMESTPTFHPWPWFCEPPQMRKHPLGWAVLVCYVTGRFAEYVESLTDDEAVLHCLAALQSAFPDKHVPQPAETHITRWGRDEFAHGSWTYFAVGSGPFNARSLREPVGVNGCIAFAGEHTCDGSIRGLDMGTVHGAWLSGEIAATKLLERIGQTNGNEAVEGQGRWRCQYRHCTDAVIRKIEGYDIGVHVEVTQDPDEIEAEFRVDPDEAAHILRAQQYVGRRGQIAQRSCWGWLLVAFDDGSPSCWWTPYCLWVLRR